MKNTYIPLDMVFIDGHGRIQQIVEQTTPHSLDLIRSNEPALAVLEIAGGEAHRLGIHPGQLVQAPGASSPLTDYRALFGVGYDRGPRLGRKRHEKNRYPGDRHRCIASFTAGFAHAGAPGGSWYIAPSVYALWLDDSRVADDDAGISLAFGRTLSPTWDVELSVFGSEHKRAADGNLELQGLAASTKRVFYRDGRVNPFLSLGVGYVKNINKPGANDDDIDALFGAGLLIDLGPARDDGTRHAAACRPRRTARLVEQLHRR